MMGTPEQWARAYAVTSYLRSLDRTFATPVLVKIGRTVYPGASYAQVRKTTAPSEAHASGDGYYCQTALYLLGDLPYAYRRRKATVFKVGRTRFVWYVAGWYDQTTPNDYHPFGRMFQLMLDRHELCRDDDGNPYTAVPMLISERWDENG